MISRAKVTTWIANVRWVVITIVVTITVPTLRVVANNEVSYRIVALLSSTVFISNVVCWELLSTNWTCVVLVKPCHNAFLVVDMLACKLHDNFFLNEGVNTNLAVDRCLVKLFNCDGLKLLNECFGSGYTLIRVQEVWVKRLLQNLVKDILLIVLTNV